MKRVIDFHAHLGDIAWGKNVIWRQGVEQTDFPNPLKAHEESGFSEPLLSSMDEFPDLIQAAYRLLDENTLENLIKRLDEDGITYIVMLPIHPYIAFEEILAASKLEPRIIPFTTVDYSLPTDQIIVKLKSDVRNGARGLKIHPVVQNISLADPKVHAAVEAMASYNLPILSHCGINDYYLDESPYPRNPELGNFEDFADLCHAYPKARLVAGHAGGLLGGEMEILAEKTKGLDNVYVDTSFRPSEGVLKAVELFGRNRVLFGTDHPFSTQTGGLREIYKACAGDTELERLLVFQNAADLLGIYQ